MTQPINKNNFAKLRIANFTSIELSLTHVLNVDSQDVQLALAELRKYADLPYVYILTKEHIKSVVDLLTELKSIRSTCYPHALYLIGGADSGFEELDTDELGLDIIKLDTYNADIIADNIHS